LRGDLPLLLGLGITAGVGPLLFVQILYREAFYTANLLMHLRFLAILPALLLCFCLLYLGKTERGRRFARWIYAAAALSALFVGYSFAELHSLAIEPALWIEQCRDGRMIHVDAIVAVRHLAFLGVAAASTGLVALWAGRWRGSDAGATMAPVAVAGLAIAVVAAAAAGRLAGPIADPPIAAAIAGIAAALIAAVGWGGARRPAPRRGLAALRRDRWHRAVRLVPGGGPRVAARRARPGRARRDPRRHRGPGRRPRAVRGVRADQRCRGRLVHHSSLASASRNALGSRNSLIRTFSVPSGARPISIGNVWAR
jgi:hypothetical protein